MIAHMLMSIGLIAALVVGQWATVVVVVFFMHVGDYAERFTTERARRAIKNLTALVEESARVERAGVEEDVPVGEVIGGQAIVDQAPITGESMPVEVGAGAKVFAATIALLGSLRVRATHVGAAKICFKSQSCPAIDTTNKFQRSLLTT